jgi:hypothetical protein
MNIKKSPLSWITAWFINANIHIFLKLGNHHPCIYKINNFFYRLLWVLIITPWLAHEISKDCIDPTSSAPLDILPTNHIPTISIIGQPQRAALFVLWMVAIDYFFTTFSFTSTQTTAHKHFRLPHLTPWCCFFDLLIWGFFLIFVFNSIDHRPWNNMRH